MLDQWKHGFKINIKKIIQCKGLCRCIKRHVKLGQPRYVCYWVHWKKCLWVLLLQFWSLVLISKLQGWRPSYLTAKQPRMHTDPYWKSKLFGWTDLGKRWSSFFISFSSILQTSMCAQAIHLSATPLLWRHQVYFCRNNKLSFFPNSAKLTSSNCRWHVLIDWSILTNSAIPTSTSPEQSHK